jgi:MazG-like family
VSNADPHMQIARKLRTVETAKTELIQQVAEVFRGVQSGNQRDLTQALGGLVGLAYYLGAQMGIPLESIDRDMDAGFPKAFQQDGLDARDYDLVLRHLGVKS